MEIVSENQLSSIINHSEMMKNLSPNRCQQWPEGKGDWIFMVNQRRREREKKILGNHSHLTTLLSRRLMQTLILLSLVIVSFVHGEPLRPGDFDRHDESDDLLVIPHALANNYFRKFRTVVFSLISSPRPFSWSSSRKSVQSHGVVRRSTATGQTNLLGKSLVSRLGLQSEREKSLIDVVFANRIKKEKQTTWQMRSLRYIVVVEKGNKCGMRRSRLPRTFRWHRFEHFFFTFFVIDRHRRFTVQILPQTKSHHLKREEEKSFSSRSREKRRVNRVSGALLLTRGGKSKNFVFIDRVARPRWDHRTEETSASLWQRLTTCKTRQSYLKQNQCWAKYLRKTSEGDEARRERDRGERQRTFSDEPRLAVREVSPEDLCRREFGLEWSILDSKSERTNSRRISKTSRTLPELPTRRCVAANLRSFASIRLREFSTSSNLLFSKRTNFELEEKIEVSRVVRRRTFDFSFPSREFADRFRVGPTDRFPFEDDGFPRLDVSVDWPRVVSASRRPSASEKEFSFHNRFVLPTFWSSEVRD